MSKETPLPADNADRTEDRLLMTLRVSPMRRGFALLVMLTLGLLLIWTAIFQGGGGFFTRFFLLATGLVVLWVAHKMRRGTAQPLELTREVLRVRGGQDLIAIADIRGLDRGFFAMKPSNGFVLKGQNKAPGLWAPGMYWRIGRRVGVGGITNAREAKSMVEVIAALRAEAEMAAASETASEAAGASR